MSEISDEELMRSYQHGDYNAFESLYQRHAGKVYGFLRKRLGAASIVDDIHQAVFLKLHEVRSQYKKEYKFAPWLFVITRTTMIDQLRKQKRFATETGTEDLLNFAGAPAQESVPNVDLSELTDDQKRILQLRYTEDKDFEAIALELKMSSSNVRQQVSRAIKKLRNVVGRK